MKKNKFKSLIKSIVRAIWKVLFKPIVKHLPESKVKRNLMRAGGKIERREWWNKNQFNTIQVYTPQPAATPNFQLSEYLLKELNELSKIESLLTPNDHFIHHLSHNLYSPPTHIQSNTIAASYGLILRYLRNLDFDVVFLAPWLKRGGADLGLLHHINAQHEKGYRVLLITTEDSSSPWLSKLNKEVKHLNFAEFARGLSENDLKVLLARLLLQTKAQTIHNINSKLGWEIFKNYGKQLNTMNKKLFASVFCEDEISPNVYWGYAPTYLLDTHHFLSYVFCDTQWYPNDLNQRLSLPALFTQTIYFPFLEDLSSYKSKQNAPILWAGRLAKQKRPELLYEIASRIPNQLFYVYGECEPHCEFILDKLKTLPNVKYIGSYNSFKELLTHNTYSAFLYTSKYDGLPNVLIEAIANGLPVISFDVGGISELIHEQTLLQDNNNIQNIVNAIQGLLFRPDRLKESWQYSHNILKNRHTWQDFVQSLENVDGYFPKLTQEEFIRLNENKRILSKP